MTSIGVSSLTGSGIISGGLTDTYAKTDPLTASDVKREQRSAKWLAAAEDAKNTLASITKDGAKGYWQWKMKQLREQITQQVEGELNVTPEKLASMPLEDRLALEKKINDMVEQRLKIAIAEEMKRRQKTLLGFNSDSAAAAAMVAQGLDISATGA